MIRGGTGEIWFSVVDAGGNPVNGRVAGDWNDVGGGITDDVELCLPGGVFDDIVEIDRIVDFGSLQGMYKYVLVEADTVDAGLVVIRSAISGYENREYEFEIEPIPSPSIHSGTAIAGTADTITLSPSALSDNGRYKNAIVVLTGGAGVGQIRQAIGYIGMTHVLSVDEAWETVPDSSTTYDLIPGSSPRAAALDVWEGLTIEGSDTGADMLRAIRAGVLGKLTGLDAIRAAGGTGVATYYAADNVTPRFTISYSTNGRITINILDLGD